MSVYANKFITLKPLDNLLNQHTKNPELYVELYEKKRKVLDAIDSKKIKAIQYAQICKKLLNQQTNEDIKTSIDMEMMMLTEGEEEEWFKEIVDQSRDQFEEQTKTYRNYIKKQSSVAASSVKPTSNLKSQNKKISEEETSSLQKKSSVHSTHSSTKLIVERIFSFKLLDSLLEQSQETKNTELFLKLFTQKQKLIELMKQNKLNSKIYHAGLSKLLKQGKEYGLNEDHIFTIQMQFDLITDLHDGDINQWFKDTVDTTGEEYEKQLSIKDSIKNKGFVKTSKKSSIKSDPGDEDNLVVNQSYFKENAQVNNAKLTETITARSNNASNAKLATTSKYLCFRYLDEKLQANKSPDKASQFCRLFEEKMKIIEMMKQGQLTGAKYRKNLTKLIDQTAIQQERQAAQMEIDMNQLSDDVDQFFESTVNQFGESYEEQQIFYKKYLKKSPGPTPSMKKDKKDGISQMFCQMQSEKILKKQLPKPEISDIVSFKAIIYLLSTFKKDYDYCIQLKQKGKKLLALVDEKKLGPNQYKQFLVTKLALIQNKQLISIMQKQLKQYQNSSSIGKIFKNSVQQYIDKVKVNFGKRKHFDQNFEVDDNTINLESKEVQIQYMLRKLAKYQSLLAYFRNNQRDKQYESFKPEYEQSKKDVLRLCELLKNGQIKTEKSVDDSSKSNVDKKIDLRQYVENHLPDVSFGMLHRCSKSDYIQEIDRTIQGLKNTAKQYLQYTKKIKKGTNKTNIQTANKAKTQIMKDIQYLESIKNKQFCLPPKVEVQKVQMYNLDLNKHLTENEIQIVINRVEGLPGDAILKLFMIDTKQPRFKADIKNGQLQGIKTIITLPPEKMNQIIKGTDKRYLHLKFAQKRWFSQSSIDEVGIQLNFIRSNIAEETVKTQKGEIDVTFTAKVHKPKKPLVTEIKETKIVKKYEQYQHSKFIQNQFLKSLMPYEQPTKSEIHS